MGPTFGLIYPSHPLLLDVSVGPPKVSSGDAPKACTNALLLDYEYTQHIMRSL